MVQTQLLASHLLVSWCSNLVPSLLVKVQAKLDEFNKRKDLQLMRYESCAVLACSMSEEEADRKRAEREKQLAQERLAHPRSFTPSRVSCLHEQDQERRLGFDVSVPVAFGMEKLGGLHLSSSDSEALNCRFVTGTFSIV